MSLDSRAKRSYAIGVGLSSPTVYDAPDGTIGAEDRYNIGFCYYLIAVLIIYANVYGNPTPTADVTGNPTPTANVEGI